MTIDIIYGETVSKGIDAQVGDGLWLSAGDFKRVSGFELKPEGFCKDAQCYPVPPARTAEFEGGGKLQPRRAGGTDRATGSFR